METDNPFEKVLDRLREKGWQKGGMGGFEGPNCIAGAHLNARLRGWRYCDWKVSLEDVIRNQYSDRTIGNMGLIPNFNDHPDTTFTDVERVLEKAAVKWEEERVLRND